MAVLGRGDRTGLTRREVAVKGGLVERLAVAKVLL